MNEKLKHLWLPCTQMKDYEAIKPLNVVRAEGSYIYLDDGREIIDGISSWWCKNLGHNHPRLKQALIKQINRFEHVIQAGTINDTIIQLSEKLSKLSPSLNKVFYTGDGSSAIEVALKMSLHFRKNQGDSKRNRFLALKNGYHGESCGALSVSDIGIYRKPYSEILFESYFIDNIPYVSGKDDPCWNDCQQHWDATEKALEPFTNNTTALILEPIVQGAGGMKIYSQDFLRRLCKWAASHNIHIIADEIMTGIGRTGKALACEHAGIKLDFLCLSKGLTSGWMAFSAILTTNDIYQAFYDDYESGKAFLHSSTYCGNPIGASIALETLNIMEEDSIYADAVKIGDIMLNEMHEIGVSTGVLHNIRGIGAIVAADLIPIDDKPRLGFEFYKKAVELGALLRPLGNTIYWLPPLNTKLKTLEKLSDITKRVLLTIYNQ